MIRRINLYYYELFNNFKLNINRQDEVLTLVERSKTQSLQDVKHEQLKVGRNSRVRSQREELGHTVKNFSKITGFYVGTIIDVELGRTSPRADTIVTL